MEEYFKRLSSHPGLGFSLVLGIADVYAFVGNKSFILNKHWIFIPFAFVFPWLFIVLLTNRK